jgi:nucleotide-binding universal stress UspA family protein
MKLNKILFPTDFSHTGDAALELATSLARDSGATIVIVHVEESPTAYGGGELYYGIPEPKTEDLLKLLHEIKPNDPQVDYRHRMITGEPASALTRLVEDDEIDIIVMGTHGRSGLTRLLMGSVAEAVVRHAKCPVITYKQPAKQTANT